MGFNSLRLAAAAAIFGLAFGAFSVADAAKASRAPKAAAPTDGPFGISMGEPLADLGRVNPTTPTGYYQVIAPPRPNATFKVVLVEAYPNTGVCRIEAHSDEFTNDMEGILVRRLVDDTAAALASKYGTFSLLNSCNQGEPACSSFWAQNVSSGAASYQDKFDFSKTPRPDHIKSVYVAASASDSFTTWVTVFYYTSNDDACAAARNAAKASSL